MIDEIQGRRHQPERVWAQSFNYADMLYWIDNEPAFGKQAVYLDSIDPTSTARHRPR